MGEHSNNNPMDILYRISNDTRVYDIRDEELKMNTNELLRRLHEIQKDVILNDSKVASLRLRDLISEIETTSFDKPKGDD